MPFVILSGAAWGVAFALSEGRSPQPLTFVALLLSLVFCLVVQTAVIAPARFWHRFRMSGTALSVAAVILYGYVSWRSGALSTLSPLGHAERLLSIAAAGGVLALFIATVAGVRRLRPATPR